MSKRAGDPYAGRRSRSWLKSKCAHSQEFVVGGFTDPTGARTGLGALLVGVHDVEGALRYAGRVGSGFDERALKRLRERLDALEQDAAPFADPPRGAQARGVHWTAPELVAEVRFIEWTGDGRLRHPVFQGLREDKVAAEVRREQATRAERAPKPAPAAPPDPAPTPDAPPDPPRRPGQPVVGGVAISHPDRLVFPDPGLTKLDVAEYYEAVAALMVPYLERRALTVIRCPDGIGSECFFQKHVTPSVPKTVAKVRVNGNRGAVTTYPVVDTAESLLAMVQNGAVEFHVWGSRAGTIETPDILVFDLDPAPELEWRRVRRPHGRCARSSRTAASRASCAPPAARVCTWWCRTRREWTGRAQGPSRARWPRPSRRASPTGTRRR